MGSFANGRASWSLLPLFPILGGFHGASRYSHNAALGFSTIAGCAFSAEPVNCYTLKLNREGAMNHTTAY